MLITATTKPNGSGRNWLEVGDFSEDEFGDRIWTPTEARYPHKDPDLKVKRDFEGRSGRASQRIYWKIIVPESYPHRIVQRWGDGNIRQIYPKEE
jgi:hypothetical protein